MSNSRYSRGWVDYRISIIDYSRPWTTPGMRGMSADESWYADRVTHVLTWQRTEGAGVRKALELRRVEYQGFRSTRGGVAGEIFILKSAGRGQWCRVESSAKFKASVVRVIHHRFARVTIQSCWMNHGNFAEVWRQSVDSFVDSVNSIKLITEQPRNNPSVLVNLYRIFNFIISYLAI